MGVLGDKLTEAFETKANDVNSFIWLGPKRKTSAGLVQDEIKLMEASGEQLQQFYDQCASMLYNKDKVTPGRYELLKLIGEQRQKCNTELFLRWLENKYQPNTPDVRKPYPRFLYLQDINTCLRQNEDALPRSEYKTTPINVITKGIPEEFRDITISNVLEGCADSLGVFDRSHLSRKFILQLGVWLTSKELADLTEKDAQGKVRDRLEVIKERHGLKSNVPLRSDHRGLHYSELRAMLNLKSNKKYSELTTEQLCILRDKVLFRFEEKVEFHITQWKERMRQLELVAEAKDVPLIIKDMA